MTGHPAHQICRRLNPWYGRSLQTLTGYWFLRRGWWFWTEHP